MREILFRGKTEVSERWVVGDLVRWRGDDMCICEEYNSTEKKQYAVIPETVGQYTGLTDKNGTRIFEGDIVGHYSNYRKKYDIGTVKYGDFNCSCCSGVYGWFFENDDIREYSSCEVLGNIYDNPELLKSDIPDLFWD